jgi:hypothetical protein
MKTNLLSRFAAVVVFSAMAFSTMNAQNPMCMTGDATKYGWNKDNSSPMTQDGVNPSKFYYSAYLFAGSFKFMKQNSDWVPSWNKGASETTVVKRPTYADPDVPFSVATAGNYAIVLDTAALTLSVTPMAETTLIMFNTVYMLGSAAPNGWDLGTATELVKNPTNPFEFSYTGALAVGTFKLPINRWWSWNKDFFMKASETLMVLTNNSNDVQWSISEAANYVVTININTLAISIVKQTATSNEKLINEYASLESNVVRNELQINNGKNSTYVINSITGANLMKGATINGKINVSSLQNGIYILNVDNKSYKFIKQ